MDSMHDLGGKQGFGQVRYVPGSKTYKHPWEAKAHMMQALARTLELYNMDEYRHAVERMEPRHYMGATYYERMLTGCATLCVEKGIIDLADLERRAGGKFPLALPSAEGRSNINDSQPLEIGDRVEVRNEYVTGHHRMPGYVRGKTGTVVAISPYYHFPDASAHGLEAKEERTYDVKFRASDLWPDACDEAHIYIALFESYLFRITSEA